MGDVNRNWTFCNWICKQFPKAKSVLVVADGKGELARKLANKGFQVRVIEASPRFSGRNHPNITYQKGFFTPNTPFDEDLIVGMHPDEATIPIVLAARKQAKPFAVVPCCITTEYSKGIEGNYHAWIDRIKSFAPGCKEGLLKFSGRNLVLYDKN